MKAKNVLLTTALAGLGVSNLAYSDALTEAMTNGTAKGDIRIRYENVDVDGNKSEGMTIRTRLGYKSGDVGNFSAYLEFEDVTDMFGVDDVDGRIPDPEVTEIDQAFLMYKSGNFSSKLGRQVITLDGHRHIGHVGWRQDRQTFDALRATYATKDFSVDFAHIYQRNRIFGETLDAKSSDNLINASYTTPYGKLVGYGYFLDDEARDEQSDTMGVSFTGKTKLSDSASLLYALEFATQEITDSGVESEPDYQLIELGAAVSGFTVKAGMETLGSDDGNASFTTPLATLHKFNGWADIFLGGTFNPSAMPNGLEDTYFSVGTKVSGIKLLAAYHMYAEDEGSDDYGSEINFVAAKKFGKHYNAGFKYAAYSDDDDNGFTTVDVDKIWVWVGASF